MSNYYENMMMRMSTKKKRAFRNLCIGQITQGEYEKECDRINKEIDTAYFKLVSQHPMILTAEEIGLDLGSFNMLTSFN